MKLLLVEDDADQAHFLATGLAESGHVVDVAGDGETALELAEGGRPDVIILDRMLPARDGLSVIAELRRRGVAAPVLLLSALGQVQDRIEGLRAGGDDYLAKPYAFGELLARIEALGRRGSAPGSDTTLRLGPLELDRLSRTVTRDGRRLDLQPREFQLLEFFLRHAGQVVTRTMLLEGVWNYHFDPQTNVIDVHVSRLRGKLDRGFERPMLHTVRGAGYRLVAPDDGAPKP